MTDYQKNKKHKFELKWEFKKIKPPTFDGEMEEAVEAWLINISKYFQIYKYDDNLKEILAIYQLHGKVTLWLEEVKVVHTITEQGLTLGEFQKHFKEKYLTEWFYDDKAK